LARVIPVVITRTADRLVKHIAL